MVRHDPRAPIRRARARSLDAMGDIFAAMEKEAPIAAGVDFVFLFIGDTNIVRDAILAPELPPPWDTVAAPLRQRTRAFEVAHAREISEIGVAICSVLAARHEAATPATCRKTAVTAVSSAFASWVLHARATN